jgi:invasion protein IalB
LVRDRPAPAHFPPSLDFALLAWHDCTAGITNKTIQDGNRQLTHFFKQTLAAAALAVTMLPGLAVAQDTTQNASTETVKATHGAWKIVCSSEQPDICVMRQYGLNAEGNKVIDLQIRKLKDAKTQDGKPIPAVVVIAAPLGVLLQAGMAIKIDENKPRVANFDICVPSGCVVRQPINEELLSEMKAGNNAAVLVVAAPKREIKIDFSLKGFTKAFKAL